MNRSRRFAAAICAGISLFASAASVHAASYRIAPDKTLGSAVVQLWFRAPSAGYDNAEPGLSRLAMVTLAASARPHGTPLFEAVRKLGGTLQIEVFPDMASVEVSVPSAQQASAIRVLAGAYFHPIVSAAGQKRATEELAVAIAAGKYDPDGVLRDFLTERAFARGPAHYPTLPSEAKGLERLTTAQVKAFALRAFRAQNAVLALAGDIDAAAADSAVPANVGAALDGPFDSTPAQSGAPVSQTAGETGFGLGFIGPPISDVTDATALDFIANYLFDARTGVLTLAARRTDPQLSVAGDFRTLHDPGLFTLRVSGQQADAFRSQVTSELARLQQPLETQSFAIARAAFRYHILAETQTASAQAANLGWFAAEGNASYAPGLTSGDYARAIDALDPQTVAHAVQTYLQHPFEVRVTGASRKDTS